MIRRSLIALCTLGALLALGTRADAQQYPPAANFLTVSDTTPTPGQTITITTGTYLSGSSITVTFFSQPVPLGSAVANAVGEGTLSATIPANASLGAHTITAEGTTAAGPLTQSVSVTVVAADGGAGAGTGARTPLPRTGDDMSLPLARAAVVLVAAGGALLLVTRRRRHADAAAA